MPTEIINQQSRLRMRFIDGIVDGRERLISRTYSGVKEDAADGDLLTAAQQLGNLQVKEVKHVIRTDEKEIVQA